MTHLLAPCGSPRVLHLPEAIAILNAVADREDTVVELRAAIPIDDAAAVELERGIDADGDGDGLVCNGLSQRGLVIGWDVLVTGQIDYGPVMLLAPAPLFQN